MDAIEMLLTRASNAKLGDPAPDAETLQLALAAGARAPDHGLLRPWRFQLVRGEGRTALGRLLREALARRKPDASAEELDKEQAKPLRAPLVVVVSARVRPDPKIPRIEQVLAAGAAAHNILLTLHARGYAGIWRTGPAAYDEHVMRGLGLAASDAIVGFVYAGTARIAPPAFERPGPEHFTEEWPPPAPAT